MKRTRNETKWKRNVAKKRKAEDKSYIGIKNKKVVLKEEKRGETATVS